MQYLFEIYISGNELTTADWQKFYSAVMKYSGMFKKFDVIINVQENIVRLFVRSDKNIGTIANNLDGMVLRPVEEDEIEIPQATSKERFVQLVTGGNLLDLKEKYEVKRGKDLKTVVLKVRPINDVKAAVKAELYFKIGNEYAKAKKIFAVFPVHLLAFNFGDDNSRYLKKTIDKYLDIEKSVDLFDTSNTGALFKVSGFPYFSNDYYININKYEFDKHSFIVGASGSGKSKLIGLYIDRIAASALKDNYRVVVVDPHAALAEDFTHIPDQKVINFGADGAALFSDTPHDIQAATELTTMLFKSLMSDQFNPKLERVLRFTLFVLFTGQAMSLDNLKRFVTDLDYRNQLIDHVKGFAPDNIIKFFGSDFNEIRTQNYNEAIVPIVSLVDEMQMQPGMSEDGGMSLANTIQQNFLTVFSLNKVSMGEKVVKTIAGLIIQQIFLQAQARSFNQKIILIIDEVSVVQNPALAQILSEARKFNLSVILTQQYFGQIEKDLQDAIFANAYNFYVFKISEEDARAIEGNLSINLPDALVEAEKAKGLKEKDVRVKILTELHPREVLVRLAANGKLLPSVKGRTVDAEFAVDKSDQPAPELKEYKQANLPGKFVEGEEKDYKPLAPTAHDPEFHPKVQQEEELLNAPFSPPPQQHTQDTDAVVDKSVSPSPHKQAANTAESVEQETPLNSEPSPTVAQAVPPSPSSPSSDGVPFNLSELLAEHSSSRYSVNKRKDQ